MLSMKATESKTKLLLISATLAIVIALAFLVPVVVSRIVQEKFSGARVMFSCQLTTIKYSLVLCV